MSPTLEAGDVVLLEKFLKQDLREGDIISMKDPSDPHQQVARRVIGFPGDRGSSKLPKNIPRIPILGYCWVERDSSYFARQQIKDFQSLEAYYTNQDETERKQMPVGLIQGRIGCVLWPLERFGQLPSYEDE